MTTKLLQIRFYQKMMKTFTLPNKSQSAYHLMSVMGRGKFFLFVSQSTFNTNKKN